MVTILRDDELTRPCAFRDCGDPQCVLCALARLSVEQRMQADETTTKKKTRARERS